MTGKIELERSEGGIATLWINNPDHRNALSNTLIEALVRHYHKLENDDTCRVIVLRGRNGIFCAGRELRDIRALQAGTNDEIVEAYTTLKNLNEAITYNRKPTVAVVEKYAFGLGATVMSWCDVVLAASNTMMAYPEVHHGIPPSPTLMALFAAVGRKKAMELILTGRRIDAKEADQIGLVSKVVPPESLEDAIQALVTGILRGSPDAIDRTKRFIAHAEGTPPRQAMVSAVDSISLGVATDQCREGVAAFFEKREPQWVRTTGGKTR